MQPRDGCRNVEMKLAALVEYLESFVSVELYGEEGAFHMTATSHAREAEVVDALLRGNADLAPVDPFGLLLAGAVDVERFEPLVCTLNNEPVVARVVVGTANASTTLEDLAGQRIAWVNAHSSAGFAVPFALLRAAGVQPAEELFVGSEEAVLQAIREGRVDAGAVSSRCALPEGFHIVCTSRPLPHDPWILRNPASPAIESQRKLHSAMRDGLLSFGASPEGDRLIRDLFGGAGIGGLDESNYDEFLSRMSEFGPAARKD